MARKPTFPPTSRQSRLEDHPEFVRAIGMISIENSNLEDSLALLFSRVIRIGSNIGRAIYLTPKSALARIEILENASKEFFRPKKRPEPEEERVARTETLSAVLSLCRRARTVIGKRHSIMHDSWGFDLETNTVVRFATAAVSNATPVDIKTLEVLISECRQLMAEVTNLASDLLFDAIP
jgi:hypothetical protein